VNPQIWITNFNQISTGTTFTIYIPKVKIAKTVTAAEGDYTWSSIRVFVAEMKVTSGKYEQDMNTYYDKTVKYVHRVRDAVAYGAHSPGTALSVAAAVYPNTAVAVLFPYSTGSGVTSNTGDAFVYRFDTRLREKTGMVAADYLVTSGKLKCGYYPEISEMWCDQNAAGALAATNSFSIFQSYSSVTKDGL
jgi:hypothetical protein